MTKLEKREFKVGYRVWSLLFGWGNIEEIDSEAVNMYPVCVGFDSGKIEAFTEGGLYHLDHENPSLFHANQGKIEFDTDEPIELVDNQPIWVLLGENWIPKHFARHSQGGGVYCYRSGKSKHSSDGESDVKCWGSFRTTDPALDGASQ